jgi:peptidoglycan/xylan/chitin deacetylase (PgdA/CDA1 family)
MCGLTEAGLGMKQVTLTFDNGPDPGGTTAFVLDELARREIPASFFVTGRQLARPGARDLARRAHDEGHWIGNHTLTHSIMFGDSEDALLVDREIGETQALMGDLAHSDRLFRPYGGGGVISRRLLSEAAVSYLAGGGYTCVLWTSVPRDWEADAAWVDRCLADIEEQDWTVVVAHDLPTGGMAYLPALLDRIEAMGAEFVQEFPKRCVPIRRGLVEGDLSAIVREARAPAA